MKIKLERKKGECNEDYAERLRAKIWPFVEKHVNKLKLNKTGLKSSLDNEIDWQFLGAEIRGGIKNGKWDVTVYAEGNGKFDVSVVYEVM